MIDLTKIDDDTLMARGAYSTYNAAHKDAKKQLAMLCGDLSATAFKVLNQMQPSSDAVPEPVDALIAVIHATANEMAACAQQVISVAQQKQDVRPLAWGRKP